jgi:hypothetical protein
MSNNTMTRLHIRNDIEAKEVNIKPDNYPTTFLHEGYTFKRMLCRTSPSRNIIWYDYHSNTIEHFWVLRVWAI